MKHLYPRGGSKRVSTAADCYGSPAMLPLARLSAAPKKFGFSVFDIMKNAKKVLKSGKTA